MSCLELLLQKIAVNRKETHPFPENLEEFLDSFVPNVLLKNETLQRAFGVSHYELEQIYQEAYDHYEQDNYPVACTIFRWLIVFNPFQEKFWMGFSACLMNQKQYEKALHGYAIAALLDNESPQPHYHAYQCYLALDNKMDAEKAWNLAQARAKDKLPEICEI